MRGRTAGNKSAGKAPAEAGGQERAWPGGERIWSAGREVERPEVRLLEKQSSQERRVLTVSQTSVLHVLYLISSCNKATR